MLHRSYVIPNFQARKSWRPRSTNQYACEYDRFVRVASFYALFDANVSRAQASIAGQLALVTGASSGIGAAIAWRLAELRCNLVLCARRTERLEDIRKQLTGRFKVRVHVVTVDLSSAEATAAFAANLPPEFSEIDILVNNAGLALGTAGAHKSSAEDTIRMINTNTTAVAILTQKFAEGMASRDRGHIVNISSIAAHYTYPGGSIYCGTKHFVDAFTNAARHDLVGTKVRVTSISPGAVQTEFSVVRYSGDQAKADAVYDGIIPLTAEDCADAVAYSVTRPPHVQVGEIVLYATYQSSPQIFGRVAKQTGALQGLTEQLKSQQ